MGPALSVNRTHHQVLCLFAHGWFASCRTAQVAEEIWAQTFKYLADNKVLFEGMLLKPSMVTPGADSGKKVSLVELVTCILPFLLPLCVHMHALLGWYQDFGSFRVVEALEST